MASKVYGQIVKLNLTSLWILASLSMLGAIGIPGVVVKYVDIGRNAKSEGK